MTLCQNLCVLLVTGRTIVIFKFVIIRFMVWKQIKRTRERKKAGQRGRVRLGGILASLGAVWAGQAFGTKVPPSLYPILGGVDSDTREFGASLCDMVLAGGKNSGTYFFWCNPVRFMSPFTFRNIEVPATQIYPLGGERGKLNIIKRKCIFKHRVYSTHVLLHNDNYKVANKF